MQNFNCSSDSSMSKSESLPVPLKSNGPSEERKLPTANGRGNSNNPTGLDLNPWLKEKTPIYVSVALSRIRAKKEFCDKYEPGFFGKAFLEVRKPDLDFRVWLREENSNVAHIANTQGFEILKIACDKNENVDFNFFLNNPIVSRDSHLALSVKIYENDQVFTDDKKDKLNKILSNLSSIGTAAIDKGMIQKTKGDTFLNYLSFIQIPFDLINNLNDFLFDEETLVTSFNIHFFQNNVFSPATSSDDQIKIEFLRDKDLTNFVSAEKGKKVNLNEISAIRYEITTTVSDLELTFVIILNRRKE